MIGKEIEVLTLEQGAAISSNYTRVRVPDHAPVNHWMQVRVDGLVEDGVQASRTTTAQETN